MSTPATIEDLTELLGRLSRAAIAEVGCECIPCRALRNLENHRLKEAPAAAPGPQGGPATPLDECPTCCAPAGVKCRPQCYHAVARNIDAARGLATGEAPRGRVCKYLHYPGNRCRKCGHVEPDLTTKAMADPTVYGAPAAPAGAPVPRECETCDGEGVIPVPGLGRNSMFGGRPGCPACKGSGFATTPTSSPTAADSGTP